MLDFLCKERYDLRDFVALVSYLRSPNGCPWDQVQTHESIRRNFLEETYEACEAIDAGDLVHMREELGDVLMQVLFHTDIEREAGHFDIDDVADAACKKLVYRHPHVFRRDDPDTPDWDTMKQRERAQTTTAEAMDSVARSLPALWRCDKIQAKAAKTGFEWPDVNAALDKIDEETRELRAAVAAGGALGYAGGMLHVVNHVFFKDLLFLVCGAVMFATHADSLDDLGGIGRKMPFTLCMFAIAGLSVVGVPPTSGFSSKWIIYHALMQAGQPFLALLSLVGSVLTLAYIAKFLHAAFLGQPSSRLDHVQEAPLTMRVPMAILAIGCIITGIFPGLMLWPINAILGDYNAGSLVVGLSGLQEGPGAWNATGLCVMMAIAAAAGWYFVRRFVVLREVDVHTCGLPPGVAPSRMAPSGIYGGLVRRLAWFPGNTSVDNKS